MSPRATHILEVDLPPSFFAGYPGVLTPPYDRIIVAADGQIRWNGESVTDAEFAELLQLRMGVPTHDSLLLAPEAAAPYSRVLEILHQITQAGLNDRCFRIADNARFARYESPETFDDPAPAEPIGCLPYE